MGHTGALGQCKLYIQRAPATSQTGAHCGTVYCTYIGHWQPAGEERRLGTEGTDNQTDRGTNTVHHTGALGHWGTVNGHRQPVRQGPLGDQPECGGRREVIYTLGHFGPQ